MADKESRRDLDEEMTEKRSFSEKYDDEPNDYKEETAAEPAVDRQVFRDEQREYAEGANADGAEGTGIGWLALVLSIISLFFLPLIMGAAGIIVGFIARRQGANTLGGWAIGIGVAAIVIMLFAAPFL